MKRFRRLTVGAILVGAVATALVFVPAAIESSSSNGLFGYVVPGTRGPLAPCERDSSSCTVWHYIYVANLNQITNQGGGTTRETLPNSFVVTSVSESISIDGVPHPEFNATYTPAPSAFIRSWSGHWPTTVKCQPTAPPDPCNEIHNPAVIPGEDTSILYAGWSHGAAEPNGTYVFKYIVHGTLNGTPVDVTATAPPIQMTS